jgi:hypothetical protein
MYQRGLAVTGRSQCSLDPAAGTGITVRLGKSPPAHGARLTTLRSDGGVDFQSDRAHLLWLKGFCFDT